jgi:hypothetical protein
VVVGWSRDVATRGGVELERHDRVLADGIGASLELGGAAVAELVVAQIERDFREEGSLGVNDNKVRGAHNDLLGEGCLFFEVLGTMDRRIEVWHLYVITITGDVQIAASMKLTRLRHLLRPTPPPWREIIRPSLSEIP